LGESRIQTYRCHLRGIPNLPPNAGEPCRLYLVIIPLLLNTATLTGFSLASAIVGGQSIAAVNPSANISVSVGIVIVCVVSFAASLLGYRTVHQWERYQWIPNIIAIVIAVGCGGKHLHKQAEVEPATAFQALSYGGLMAGYFMTFGGTVSDYSVYHHPDVRKSKIFAYLMAAFVIPSVPLLVLGAAIGGALPNVPEWNDAFEKFGIGGVMAEMLAPAGGFGKFVLVVLALSIIGNITISMYSIAINLQMILPIFANIHRFVWVVITMAIMIPMAIRSAEEWEETLINFLSVIGYWAGCFDAVLIEELLIFRKGDWSSFDHSIWNAGRKLPSGIPAIVASALSFGLVVPGMSQVWYTGPIAKTTGDIGFELAFVLTGIFYVPLRWLEIKKRGHL
jgi:purine-cytosine permease-like protein